MKDFQAEDLDDLDDSEDLETERERTTQYREDIFLHASDDMLPNYLRLIEEIEPNEYAEDSLFATFHPRTIRMVEKDDDYYLDSRANHFVLIFGCSEGLPWCGDCVVMLANHKGDLHIKVYEFAEGTAVN